MLLWKMMQSIRPCAKTKEEIREKKGKTRHVNFLMRWLSSLCGLLCHRGVDLLIPQSLHRIEPRRSGGRIESRKQADQERKSQRATDQPERDRPNVLRRKSLACEIDVGAEINDSPDDPSQNHTKDSPQKPHSPGLGKEQGAYVPIARAHGLHDSNFTAPFKNRHHQSIDDPDGCNRQGQ